MNAPNRILVVNPGSTSTRVTLFEDEKAVAERTAAHSRQVIEDKGGIPGQRRARTAVAMELLQEEGIQPGGLAAVVGRGGIMAPIRSGTYAVNLKMEEDLASPRALTHASALGGLVAAELGRIYHAPAFVVDPVSVDEMEAVAKLSGIPGIERRSIFHALNSKAVARRCAADAGISYDEGRFVVAHLGGGISVGAHRYGRVVDVNDTTAGDGPFSPGRSGGVPLSDVIEMCFSGRYQKQEILDLLCATGGMTAYLGTYDMQKVEEDIRNGDSFAALVAEAMAYQVAKEIGAMAAVLDGSVDGIALTGGLAFSGRFTGNIRQKVRRFAPVYVYAGEQEMLALAQGALRVLRGEEQVQEYRGQA